MTTNYISHIPRLNEKHPVIHPPILPCPCNSEFSCVCVSDDEGWHWVTCLGCFRETSTRAATTDAAVEIWNSEVMTEPGRCRLNDGR